MECFFKQLLVLRLVNGLLFQFTVESAERVKKISCTKLRFEEFCSLKRTRPGVLAPEQLERLNIAISEFVEALDKFTKGQVEKLEQGSQVLSDIPQEPFPDPFL